MNPNTPNASHLDARDLVDEAPAEPDGIESQVAEGLAENIPAAAGQVNDESPEKVPGGIWTTLVMFAAFVIAFGTCAGTFMFN